MLNPKDSVSNAGFKGSSTASMRSGVSSTRSSSSAKARAAARKAALEAQTASIKRMHELQAEELRLQQKKTELQLSTDIAVAEAERKAYGRAEAEEMVNVYPHEDKETREAQLPANTQLVELLPTRIKAGTTPTISLKPGGSQQGYKQEDLFPTSKHSLDPAAEEWYCGNNQHQQTPFQASNQANLSEDFLHKLMETHDRQTHALQLLVHQQQQGVMALWL